MKAARHMSLFVLSLGMLTGSLAAQDDVLRAMERQELEERFRNLQSRVEQLEASNVALQRKVGDLELLVRSLKDQVGSDRSRLATQDDLRQVVEKLQELDRKRQEDLKQIAGEIAGLGSKAPPPRRSTPERDPASTPEKGYEYVVQSGDTLSSIIGAYNAEFKKQGKKSISLQQVQNANPGLKPEVIHPGQKIFIPMP